MIRAYASRTGTAVNLDGLRTAGWGLLISAYGVHRSEGFDDHMLDPGAWSVKPGQTWDPERFERLLDLYGSTSAQTIAPDIVSGGRDSLALSLSWLPRLREYGRPVLLTAQDGLEAEDMRPHIGGDVALAVGGSTAWKWRTLGMWCDLGREIGCRVHVLRANSTRMISWAAAAGATSFDGSGPSKFRDCLDRMDRGRRPTTAVFPGFALPSPFTPKGSDDV